MAAPHEKHGPRALALGVALGLLSQARPCAAGNDDEVLIGPDAMMTGGAMTAVASEGSALWYNPAGLASAGAHQVDFTGTAYTLRLWRIPNYLVGPDGSSSNGNTREAVTVPSAVTYVRTLNEKWSVGFGYFLSRWSDIRGFSSLSFPDAAGTATWQAGYVQTYSLHNVVVGASYRAASQLHFGAGLVGFYNGVNYASQVSGGIVGGSPDVFVTSTSQGHQGHFGLQLTTGLKWLPRRDLSLGLSVRSGGLGLYHSFADHGYATGSLGGTALGGAPEVESIPFYFPTSEERTELRPLWVLPPRLRLGVAHDLRRGVWSFDIDVQPAVRSRETLVGTRTFRASDRSAVLNARLGGKWIPSDTLAIGGGVFTDRASEKSSAVGEGTFDFYGASAGIELGNVHRLAPEETRQKIRFTTNFGVRYAIGLGEVQGVKLPYFADLLGSTDLQQRSPRAIAHEVTLNVGGGITF